MPLCYPDEALLASAFQHCEPRKVNKSGCISFMGKDYDVGLLYAGQQVDDVYDPQSIAKVRIEARGHEYFQILTENDNAEKISRHDLTIEILDILNRHELHFTDGCIYSSCPIQQSPF